MNSLKIRGKTLKLPMFFPDATRAVVRSADSIDVKNAGIEGVLVNTLHLMLTPGDAFIRGLGGVGRFMSYEGPTVSDSGGFQVFSLIKQGKMQGRVTDEGLSFWASTPAGRKKYLLTPERSIEVQFNLGTDIMVVLDDFCPPRSSKRDLEAAVRRTIEWAARSKAAYEKELKKRKIKPAHRPMLLSVIQGGEDKKLRKLCADELIKIGFDGYGFGGWPFDEEGNLDYDIYEYVGSLIPKGSIAFGLGLGKPADIVAGVKFGFNMFDCVLPTRDARHGRLYCLSQSPADTEKLIKGIWTAKTINKKKLDKLFEHIYIRKSVYKEDLNPISRFCDCYTCTHYSRAYLSHLFQVGDTLAYRLTTIHNLHLYSTLMKIIRKAHENA